MKKIYEDFEEDFEHDFEDDLDSDELENDEFDYPENYIQTKDEDDEFQSRMRMKNISNKFKPDYEGGRQDKWKEPKKFSPLKSDDLSLDNYLKKIKQGKLKEQILEQTLNAQKTDDGKLNINGHKYKLEVQTALGWVSVNIKKLVQTANGWEVEASKGWMSQTKTVPNDTVSIIKQNIGKPTIDLGGKEPKRLVKEEKMKKVIKLTESDINRLVKKVLNEQETQNYMFFSNLEQIKRQCELLLELDPSEIENILQNGHDWADDHVTVAKENMDQVFDFMMNQTQGNDDNDMVMEENRKKTGTKLCARGKAAAKAKFKVYPSAYANGYAVQVCKGKMPGSDGKKHCSAPYC